MKESCKDELLHGARVQSALENMPAEEEVEEMAARFKSISEPSRLKILLALRGGELCVEHITQAVGGNQSAVSHQLKTLRDNRIIKCRRDGKKILYALADSHVMAIIQLCKEHLSCE